MTYSITLQNLPYEPEKRQVVFVESKYDERINTIIRDNYDRIKSIFKDAELDFIYLPMLFKDEEIKNKVLYLAPYLTPENMENIELHSNHLLQYRDYYERSKKIAPSLIYAPMQIGFEWTFQRREIVLENDDRETIVSWFKEAIKGVEFLLNDHSSDAYICDNEFPTMVGESTEEGLADLSSCWDSVKRGIIKFGKSIVEEEGDEEDSSEKKSDIEVVLDSDIEQKVAEYERIAQQLLSLGLSPTDLYELIQRLEKISKLRITEDLRITLPDYNNIEVPMSALYKAVYFLFLNHPEGIILQRLEDYHRELMNYYCQTSNKKKPTQQMVDTINRLEFPGNNSIHIVLSRIKSAFYQTFDKHLAKRYIIKGTPGELYKISLDEELIDFGDEKE